MKIEIELWPPPLEKEEEEKGVAFVDQTTLPLFPYTALHIGRENI